MNTDRTKWIAAMTNLINRRKERNSLNDNYKANPRVADYRSHLSMVTIGKSVIDVGCGSMSIRDLLPYGIKYTGIDAFPVNDDVLHIEIEDSISTAPLKADTVIAFAVLDGIYDLSRACSNMKNIAANNIVILTGVNIHPDKFHTLYLTLEGIRMQFLAWKETVCHEITNNIYLLEYTR